MDYMNLYKTNPKVKRFVDDYIRSSRHTVEEALTHKVVQVIIESYLTGGTNNAS